MPETLFDNKIFDDKEAMRKMLGSGVPVSTLMMASGGGSTTTQAPTIAELYAIWSEQLKKKEELDANLLHSLRDLVAQGYSIERLAQQLAFNVIVLKAVLYDGGVCPPRTMSYLWSQVERVFGEVNRGSNHQADQSAVQESQLQWNPQKGIYWGPRVKINSYCRIIPQEKEKTTGDGSVECDVPHYVSDPDPHDKRD